MLTPPLKGIAGKIFKWWSIQNGIYIVLYNTYGTLLSLTPLNDHNNNDIVLMRLIVIVLNLIPDEEDEILISYICALRLSTW